MDASSPSTSTVTMVAAAILAIVERVATPACLELASLCLVCTCVVSDLIMNTLFTPGAG